MKKQSRMLVQFMLAMMTLLLLLPALVSAQNIHLSQFIPNPNLLIFPSPIGIDFHEPNAKVIASANYPTGADFNLELIDPASGAGVGFGGLKNLTDELKIATVRTSPGCQQFPVGEVFTANGAPGEIIRVDKLGNVSGPAPAQGAFAGPNGWVKLPGEGQLLRGSFFVDRFCAFDGDLIVATGNDDPTGGGHVWRVTSAGIATLVAVLKDADGNDAHLEGLITLPNDPKYGPWAGTILVGNEYYNINASKHGRIFSITPAGVATPYDLTYIDLITGITHTMKPEDLDLLEPGADFFGVNFGDGRVVRVPATELGVFAARGDILLTQEFPCNSSLQSSCGGSNTSATTGLYAIQYVTTGGNAAGGIFNVVELKFDPNSDIKSITQWEHVTIAPRGDVSVAKTTPNASIKGGDTATYKIVVTSKGPSFAFNVVLNDVLPALPSAKLWTISGADAASVCGSATQPFTRAGGTTLTCNFGPVAPGVSKTITLTYATTTADCGNIENLATANANNDADSTNNASGPIGINVKCKGPNGDGRMTGGGSVFTSAGKRVTHGFEIHCDPAEVPNRLEINWDGGNNFHLETLVSAFCFDDPKIDSGHPRAPFDTYIGFGIGKLNGVNGATAAWTFTDAGEPGTSDTATILIKDSNGNTVLTVSGLLDKGNQQAHKDNK